MNFVLNPNFFLPGTNLSLKVQARIADKVRIKNLKSRLAFFDKFCWALHATRGPWVDIAIAKHLKAI